MHYRAAALRAKIGPDEAEPDGRVGSTVKGENEVWSEFQPIDQKLSPWIPGFAPQPKGLGPISLISLSLVASRHPVCVLLLRELRKIGAQRRSRESA